MIYLYAVIAGFLLDFILGDPHNVWHPVCAIGKLINQLEKPARKWTQKSKRRELAAGAIVCVTVLVISVFAAASVLFISYEIHPVLHFIVAVILCYQMIATKSLKVESTKVYKALMDNDVEAARYAVSMIVGRDTKSLSEEGIIKAAVETVAENTSDGSVAPLFYMILFGPLGGVFYKAINTMDSMVGYKNEKYLYFGRVAARLDDVVNYIPARFSSWCMIFASFLLGYDGKGAYRIYKRDRYNHASPNSAHTEAVVAGALNIQLAGDAYYFGKLYKKKTIGDAIELPKARNIKDANRLLYGTALSAAILLSIIKYIVVSYVF